MTMGDHGCPWDRLCVSLLYMRSDPIRGHCTAEKKEKLFLYILFIYFFMQLPECSFPIGRPSGDTKR